MSLIDSVEWWMMMLKMRVAEERKDRDDENVSLRLTLVLARPVIINHNGTGSM